MKVSIRVNLKNENVIFEKKSDMQPILGLVALPSSGPPAGNRYPEYLGGKNNDELLLICCMMNSLLFQLLIL